ncbi:hypothetical protein NJI34_25930 [Pseudomonas sp. S 311-6]|uniref:hypothetical protein n=1 Tax=Pseudomonas TaxID=286 RepID=UPI001CE3CBCD|nr:MULTISPECIES: hypothetical protein [Pseudomonas]MCO7640216.1 hypothetical protein [Pseudomonas sp. S 311-6]MCO7565592.1 hypothetical protein [Pseudomonas mosselii]MCO7593251.1 hypothetical protein [Pseudomonas guariconensis]MCO7617700.1 hypothetical protein [Pseudomonas guariconensis]MCU7223064.1 hypothetical protein [Pseudomonas brassicacearum]
MNVYIEKHPRQGRWWVHMDLWRVAFNSHEEARQFVERLNSRLNAPHSLAMIAPCPVPPDHLPRPSARAHPTEA